MLNVIIDIAGTYLRYLMVGIGAWLVSRHVGTAEQMNTLTTEMLHYLELGAPIIVALLWGAAKNIWNKQAVLTALMMPKGSTEDDLKYQIKTGIVPTVTTPSDTAPGVPLN